ncbi:uncharacterized protein [Watersipora subatra]|uniref:uncharacterized protein n=1 Tax=Watersipora subatra TaxID=2589382 RepID=UPI00355AD538
MSYNLRRMQVRLSSHTSVLSYRRPISSTTKLYICKFRSTRSNLLLSSKTPRLLAYQSLETSSESANPSQLTTNKTGDKTSAAKDGVQPQHSVAPSAMDKWMLVYTKTYPDKESIPDIVPTSKMLICRDKMRVPIAMFMAALTLFLCLIVSISGSKALRNRSGKTIHTYAEEQFVTKDTAAVK